VLLALMVRALVLLVVTVPNTFNLWSPALLLKAIFLPAATAIVDPTWKLTSEKPLMV
jgi:hypothetical protein